MHYAFDMKICLHSHFVYHDVCIVVVVVVVPAAAVVFVIVVVVAVVVTACYAVKHFFGYLACVT